MVEGNLIGTDITGDALLTGPGPAYSVGVVVGDGSTDITIGGTTAMARNIVSGNTGWHFHRSLQGPGLDVIRQPGRGQLHRHRRGGHRRPRQCRRRPRARYRRRGQRHRRHRGRGRNIISGNVHDGIEITGTGTTANTVSGNFIGTNAAGTAPVPNGTGPQLTPNGDAGIEIEAGTSGNSIGGTTPGARNLISGNGAYGIAINAGAAANVVEGNYIGTDHTGNAALGSGVGYMGVLVQGVDNTIGGTASGAGNVIAGSDRTGSFFAGDQLVLGNAYEYDTTGNVVQGNLIGLGERRGNRRSRERGRLHRRLFVGQHYWRHNALRAKRDLGQYQRHRDE